MQHAQHYAPLTIRNAVIPVTNFGAKLSRPLLMIGLLLGYPSLVSLGILAFSLVTFFQLITLPVEFNASSRAMRTLVDGHILRDEQEIDGYAPGSFGRCADLCGGADCLGRRSSCG